MSTKKIVFGAFLFSLTLVGCGHEGPHSDGGEAGEEKNLPDYEAYIEEHKAELEDILTKIESVADIEQDHALIYTPAPEGTYNFDAVVGTHSGNASVKDGFNAIMLSTSAFGKELPEGMQNDFYRSDLYKIADNLVRGKEIKYQDGIPTLGDDRYPSAAIAYMEALQQVEYVFLVDVVDFDKGSILTFLEELYPPSLNGVMTIYNLKKDEVVTQIDFQIGGYETLYYSYDENGSYEAQQTDADKALENKNASYFPEETMKLFMGEEDEE